MSLAATVDHGLQLPALRLPQGAERKRLLTALAVAVLAHVVALVVLALPARFKMGVERTDPLVTRWIPAPTVASPGLAHSEPTPPAKTQPKARAPVNPKPRADRNQPSPRPARDDDEQVAARSAQAASAPASAAAAASPLPEGQDPLRMLPTTPERFQMLDELSRLVESDPSMYAPGNAISLTVEFEGKPKVWRFIVMAEETVRSVGGLEVPTLRLMHYPENERDDKVEAWLVPQLAYRPIQLIVTSPDAQSAQSFTARAALDQLDQAARNRVQAGGPAASAPTEAASR